MIQQFHFGYLPEDNWKRYMHPMLIAALYTIAKVWKQPVLDEWIKMMWEIHVMEQYSATKKKVLTFQTTWIDLENIREYHAK